LIWNEIAVMKELGENEFTNKLFEVYDTNHSIYLVMEYLPGNTLFRTICHNKHDSQRIK